MASTHRIETLDEAGRRIRVGPGDPTTADVLEYAGLLIQTEGWNQDVANMASGPGIGWTLHDSIGEACTRLSATSPGGRGSKGAEYYSPSQQQNVSLRVGAQEAVDTELRRMAEAGEWAVPTGHDLSTRPDYTYNDDPATTQDGVIAVLQRAREAV